MSARRKGKRQAARREIAWPVALLLCVTACYLSLLFRALLGSVGGRWPEGVLLLAEAFASVVSFLLPAFLGVFVFDGNQTQLLQLNTLSAGHKLYLSLLGVTAIFPMTLMNDLWTYLLTSARPGAAQGMAMGADGALLLLAALKSALLAPICEEVFFRGYLLGALERFGRKAAVCVSALAFALAHGLDLQLLIPRFLLGVMLGVMMIRAQSLLAPIVVHGFYNLTILLVSFSGMSALFDRLTIVTSLVRLLGCAGFFMALKKAYAAYPSRREFHMHMGRLRTKDVLLLIAAPLLLLIAAILPGVIL